SFRRRGLDCLWSESLSSRTRPGCSSDGCHTLDRVRFSWVTPGHQLCVSHAVSASLADSAPGLAGNSLRVFDHVSRGRYWRSDCCLALFRPSWAFGGQPAQVADSLVLSGSFVGFGTG